MKSIKKKVIRTQAKHLDMVVRDIKSITKTRTLLGGKKLTYERHTRSEILKNNGEHYRPTNIKSAIAGMSDYQKARLGRILVRLAPSEHYTPASGMRKPYGRQRRTYGGYYLIKDVLCHVLFSKETPNA